MTENPTECKSCQMLRGEISLTNAPRILESRHWIIEHVHPTRVRGWLVLVTQRHVTALHDLNADENRELSILLPRVYGALRQVTGCQKEYLMQFAEGEGFQHVHFHLVPRMADWPPELRGGQVFNGLGEKDFEPLGADVTGPTAEAIAKYLMDFEDIRNLVG